MIRSASRVTFSKKNQPELTATAGRIASDLNPAKYHLSDEMYMVPSGGTVPGQQSTEWSPWTPAEQPRELTPWEKESAERRRAESRLEEWQDRELPHWTWNFVDFQLVAGQAHFLKGVTLPTRWRVEPTEESPEPMEEDGSRKLTPGGVGVHVATRLQFSHLPFRERWHNEWVAHTLFFGVGLFATGVNLEERQGMTPLTSLDDDGISGLSLMGGTGVIIRTPFFVRPILNLVASGLRLGGNRHRAQMYRNDEGDFQRDLGFEFGIETPPALISIGAASNDHFPNTQRTGPGNPGILGLKWTRLGGRESTDMIGFSVRWFLGTP